MSTRFLAVAKREGFPPKRSSDSSEALESRREVTPVREETLRVYEKLVRKLDQRSETSPPVSSKDSRR